MKSFALHLVVVFIIGAQYHHHQIGTFCSSTSSLSTSTETTKPQAVVASVAAHDKTNFSTNRTRTVLTSARGLGGGSSNDSTFHHQQQRIQRSQQTTKTPRTIQRLVGGHLQHYTPTRKPTDEEYTTTTQLSKIYFRRKPSQLRNTYRTNKFNSTTSKPNDQEELVNDVEDMNSDVALLEEDPKELDNWDNGIFRSSAGAGKENTVKSKKKEDSKKTLADQVRDGKYGLIEKELFQTQPKKPGIISYLPNKEVPNDNSKNLGGLNEEDIWLAEDHLLVLKGGSLNDDDEDQPWEPIDDYQAPSRQIKIPQNPKVPPPFPVQFEDNGPIQFIGNHKFPFISSLANETLSILSGDSYIPPEANGDNEENIVTGTRTFKNFTNNKGGYFYAAPNPPWFFNNQTFTNPFLNNPQTQSYEKGSKPPSGGSLDNNTDYIDEDDPTLYYPPPYSFVYESNYSSPVAPGPLVPGIILPPPPNAFARLEDKKIRPHQQEVPFRQILTKISEYKPKTVIVATTPPIVTTTPSPTTTTIYTPPRNKDIVFAVTKPVKKPERVRVYTPIKQYVPVSQYVTSTSPPQTPPPENISFVPKGQSIGGVSGKGNPIYYEYFDARKVPNNRDYYRDYISTTPPPPSLPTLPPNQARPYNKIQVTTIRPVQPPRLSKSYLPTRPFNYNEYIYITPKPEIRPNGLSDGFVPSFITKSTYKPIQDFDREVDAIRQTLQYYKAQQIQQNNIIPRTSKPKAVYEYSFDATKSNRNFQPPLQIDDEPFKPMVKYSPPVDDANGFKAIPYIQADEESQSEQDYYIRTSTPSQLHKNRLSSKSYIQPVAYSTTTPSPENQVEYTTGYQQLVQTPQHSATHPKSNRHPWISIEKQIVQEVPSQTSRISVPKHRASAGYSRNVDPTLNQYNSYYYSASPPPRQNNRYYQVGPENMFSRQVTAIKAHLRPYKLREHISLENDTYVNYAPNRPPINPNAEFIRPQPFQQDYYQQQSPRSPPLFPISHHFSHNQGHSRPSTNSRLHSYQPISLQRDTLVNYRQPLPPINPDSEYIQPQRQIPQSQYRQAPPPPPPPNIQYRLPSEQADVYYYPSRDVRYTRNNN